jgi:sulfofructose kinase
MKRICCVGISTQDRIFTVGELPREEGKYFASALKEQGGGPAATAAVAAARLGLEADMIARVGDDATGKSIISGLEQEKVGTSHMRVISGAMSTQAAITVDGHGSRIIVSYPSPSLDPDPSFIDGIDFSGYDAVLADVRWPEGARKALEKAKEAGIPSVLDADITPQPIDELAAMATYPIFSKPGLAKYAGTADIDSAIAAAVRRGCSNVCVTLGADGYSSFQNPVFDSF